MDKTHNNRSTIIDLCNSAYDSYLLAIDPVIILHTYITDLVKVLGAQCSAVMKYDSSNQSFEIVTHASCSSEEHNNLPNTVPAWLIFSNYVRNHNKLNNSSIVTKCITESKTRIERKCRLIDVLGIDVDRPASDLDIDSVDNDSVKSVNNTAESVDSSVENACLDEFSKIVRETILFIPCCIAGTPHGVIILCFDKPFDGIERDMLVETVHPIENMTGVLMYNMTFRPLHIDSDRGAQTDHFVKGKRGYNTKQIDSSVTFQLIHDTLNAVTDAIVVTDTDMRIVYKNDQFVNIIKSRYKIDALPEYIIDIIPQTITLMGSKDGDVRHSSSFYRNKKIEVEPRPCSDDELGQSLVNSHESLTIDVEKDVRQNRKKSFSGTLDIHVNSTVSCGDIYHIFRLHDSDSTPTPDTFDKSKSSKNLVAYMSHELRNPIQAISTGVYLIDKTIKSMNKKRSGRVNGSHSNKNLVKELDSTSESTPDSTPDSMSDVTSDMTSDTTSDYVDSTKKARSHSINESTNESMISSTGELQIQQRHHHNTPNSSPKMLMDKLKGSEKDSGKPAQLRRQGSGSRTTTNVNHNKDDINQQTQHSTFPTYEQHVQACADARCSVLLRRSYIDPKSKDTDKESELNDTIDGIGVDGIEEEEDIEIIDADKNSDITGENQSFLQVHDRCNSSHKDLLIKDDLGEETMIECCSGVGDAEIDSVFDTKTSVDVQILKSNAKRSCIDKIKSEQLPDSPSSGEFMRDSSLSYRSDIETVDGRFYTPSRKGSGQSDQDCLDSDDNDLDAGFDPNCDLIGDCDMSKMKLMSMDTLRGIIKRVSSACKNMNIIIDDILDLSKIDNDELIMNLDEHSLQEISEMIVEESKSEVRKKGLKFVYEFDESCPETIYTDGTRVFQIISNLVSNAIKYSSTGTIKFRVGYDGDANTIVFQVSDQGRGIRREEIPNLFKQFGRTSNSVTEINSTGLGLCVCQKIASLLGGSIDVTSEYRRGSTFTFTHPIKLGYSGTRTDTEQFVQREIKGDVLIVDDDPNITSLFKLLLRCMNYDKGYELNIETANTGDKAIKMANIKQYSLIFMDIDLDGEDGCTICNRILNESSFNKTTPVVAVTANIKSVQHDRDPRFNQFSDVVLKPFNNKNISECLIKHLGYQV
ncbi:hypothetical protein YASMINEVIRUS_1043 [Yasminevirus sp. GU-2018]|uniref:histidine kinase n=1 Tax=Yasminevirus sp. GU-2018 TaxID=2420051 RepID=A0A5K0UA58_9VIRU|nr:hypothetical protein YASMINEVIRUS_1043 [Yasminevirus sp. GU-2018]